MRYFLLLSLSAVCFVSGNTLPTLAETKPDAAPQTYEYPQEVVRTFMKGCGFTNSKAFCSCSLDGLRAQYSFADFLKIDTAVRETRKVPPEVIQIFQACRAKIPN